MAENGNLWLWIGIGGTVAAVAITAMVLFKGDGCDSYETFDFNVATDSIGGLGVEHCQILTIDAPDDATDDNDWYYGMSDSCSSLLDIEEKTTTDDDGNGYKVYEIKYTGDTTEECTFEIVYGNQETSTTETIHNFGIYAVAPE